MNMIQSPLLNVPTQKKEAKSLLVKDSGHVCPVW